MAQKVQVLLLCDLEDGNAEAEETIHFGVGNTAYEIDVCAKHAQQIRAGLEPYVSRARKAAGVVPAGSRRRRERSASSREQSSNIRAWAKQRGIQINERGRIPESIVKEYEQAH